jgi:hypothetical protein
VGAYDGETWISISDVGRTFEGVELTMHEYLRVENAHLDAVRCFMGDAGVATLTVRDAEQRAGHASPLEGEALGVEQVCQLVRSMLRGTASCLLESASPDFYLHVGFDLYMYVGTEGSCDTARRQTEEAGLFVEPDWPSPYLR